MKTIKEHLTDKNSKVSEFAKLVPCAPETLSMIMNGKRAPSYKMTIGIITASKFEITPDGIFAPFLEALK